MSTMKLTKSVMFSFMAAIGVLVLLVLLSKGSEAALPTPTMYWGVAHDVNAADEAYTDEVIQANASVSVDNGFSLTLNNCTLMFDTNLATFYVGQTIPSNLTLNNSNVTSTDSATKHYVPRIWNGNLTIRGSRVNETTQFQIDGGVNYTIDDSQIDNSTAIGLYVLSGGGRIANTTIRDTGNVGLFLENSDDHDIDNVTVANCAGYCVQAQNADNVSIRSSYITEGTAGGLNIARTAGALGNVSLWAVTFEDPGTYGIRVSNTLTEGSLMFRDTNILNYSGGSGIGVFSDWWHPDTHLEISNMTVAAAVGSAANHGIYFSSNLESAVLDNVTVGNPADLDMEAAAIEFGIWSSEDVGIMEYLEVRNVETFGYWDGLLTKGELNSLPSFDITNFYAHDCGRPSVAGSYGLRIISRGGGWANLTGITTDHIVSNPGSIGVCVNNAGTINRNLELRMYDIWVNDSNSGGGIGRGMYIKGANVTAGMLNVQNSTANGMELHECTRNVVADSTFYNNSWNAIYVNKCNDTSIIRANITMNGGTGVFPEDSDNLTFESCTIRDNGWLGSTQGGIYIQRNAGQAPLENITVINTTFVNNTYNYHFDNTNINLTSLNCTLDGMDTNEILSNTNVTHSWFVRVRVVLSMVKTDPVVGAYVNLTNGTGVEAQNLVTDAAGYADWIVMRESIEGTGVAAFNPYDFGVEWDGLGNALNGQTVDSFEHYTIPIYTSAPPASSLPAITPYWDADGTVNAAWTATDDQRLKDVSLMYQHSLDNITWSGWTFYENQAAAGASDSGSYNFVAPDGEGHYLLRTNATDGGWNTEAALTDTVCFGWDLTVPTSNCMPIADVTHATAVAIPWTASDNLVDGIMEVELWVQNSTDGTTYGSYTLADVKLVGDTSDFVFNGEWKTYYRFYTRARDFNGNYEPAPGTNDTGTYLFEDNEMPATSISYGAPSYVSGQRYVNSSSLLTLTPQDTISGVEGTVYQVFNGSWSAVENYTAPFTVDGPDGNIYVRFWSTDVSGMIEVANNVTVVLDNTAPASAIFLEGSNYSAGPKYVLNDTWIGFTAADGGSGPDFIEYDIDSAGWTVYTVNQTLNVSGAHTIQYRAVDNLGQVESDNTVSVSVDDQAPKSKLTVGSTFTDAGGAPIVSPNAPFTLSATDFGSGVAAMYYSIDGGAPQLYAGTFNVPAGTANVSFWAVDNLGHVEAANVQDVVVDSQGASVSATIGAPKSGTDPIYISVDTEFNATAADDVVGVQWIKYSVDGGSWKDYDGNFTIASAGAHTVSFRAADMLDQEAAWVNLTVTIDDTAPVIGLPAGIIDGGLEVEAGDTVEFSVIDDGAGGGKIYYSVDGGASFQEYAGPITVTDDVEILYYAVDALGNQGATQSLTVSVASDVQAADTSPWDFIKSYWYIPVILVAAIVLAILMFARASKGPKDMVPEVEDIEDDGVPFEEEAAADGQNEPPREPEPAEEPLGPADVPDETPEASEEPLIEGLEDEVED